MIQKRQLSLPFDGEPARRGALGRAIAAAAGVVLVGAGILLSMLLFAVLAGTALLVGGYLWWKTRELRRQLQERSGRIIEGEVVGNAERRATSMPRNEGKRL
jgi:membrane protein implicated in regulation of membrane protease activity